MARLLVGQARRLTLGARTITVMICSPVLHNAPTVLVSGTVGGAPAQRLKSSLNPFLRAVATGAGSDFLRPVGHQSNTLVLGPGGGKIGDDWTLGRRRTWSSSPARR